MERTMTIKKFFAPSNTRLGRQQWFRNVWQRLTVVLMLVMLTTATAWAQETMTVTAEDVTVTYDGSEHYITVNVSVPESGATITYCETENGTYTSTNPTYTDAGVRTVYYKVTASGYADYSRSATVTINKAPLTITANSKSINYGDAPANDGVTYDGFVNNEDASVLVGTLDYGYTYTQYSPIGNYEIMPSGLSSNNYNITFKPGTLTVDKKSLTVAANDITIDHGAAAPAYTYSVTGLVGEDALATAPTLSSTYTQGAAIGTYPISISGAAASANYTISYTPGTLTVQSKKYTVTFQNEDGTQLQSSEVEWGETPAYTGETPTKAATAQYTYTFAGWSPAVAEVTEDATYTATYSSTAVSYTINYVLYGGTNNENNPTTYTCESADITLGEPTAPENSGYTFGGWYTDANFENSVDDTAIPHGSTGEMTFYAEWKTTLTATAVWDDDNNKYGVRPETVTVTLSDGTNETSYPLDNNSNPLTCTVYDLQKYKNGTEIVYTWTITGALDCYEQNKVVNGTTTTFTLTLKTNGYCGTDNPTTTDVDESKTVTWNYNTSTKTITIAGSGPMMYYNSVQNGENWNNGAPWKAFAGEIEHVVISDGITYVGSNTFAHCPNISSVTLPTDQQLYEIGPGAFGDCTSLTSIDIPMSVNKINDEAFAGCSNLASVTLGYGDGAKFTIGTEVFPATTTIIVPAVALQSYLQASSWCAYADKIITTGYCGKDDTETEDVDESHNVIWTLAKNTGAKIEGNEPLTLTISKNPEVTAEGADFSMAGGWPFDDGDGGIDEVTTALSITQAVISDGVTSIGESAFLYCENLTTVSIPSTVTSIGTGAFVECKSLTSNITIPDGVRVINNSTFKSCAKLSTVVLPSGLTTIGASAFAGCDKLSSIGVAGSTTNALPTSLTTIGKCAFQGSGLPAITLNEGLKTIGGGAFSPSKLTTINIPASVENIGEGALLCTGLASISVADGNTHFTTDGDKALIAHIDDNNTTLLTYARANTAMSYAVPDGVTRIGAGAFSNSDHLTEVILPEGLVTIGDGAFSYCDELTNVILPEGLTTIGANAFDLCHKIETFVIPSTVTYIGDYGLSYSDYCIMLPTTPPEIGRIGVDTHAIGADSGYTGDGYEIYVPASSLDAYRQAAVWNLFHDNRLVAGDDPVLFSSVATNAWMTWCSDKAYGKPAGCKAYTVSAVNDDEVTLAPVAGLLLPAYTPLLIKRDDTSVTLTAIGGVAVTEPSSGYNTLTGLVTKAETGFSMLGAATDAPVSGSITAGYSYALFDGEFLKIDDSTLSIPAHRCILTLPEPLSASRLSIVDGNGDTTGIISVHSSQSIVHSEADAWYTLDGRKLDKQPTVKGLYIHNGRKVVIK